MPDIIYTRTFKHEDWIDYEDVVQAEGEKGFNGKFHAIENEFDRLASVVQQINTTLKSLGEKITVPITIGLTPILLPYQDKLQWSTVSWSESQSRTYPTIPRASGEEPPPPTRPEKRLGTFVERPSAQSEAWGVLPLNLPNGATLISLKVLGEVMGGGNVTTQLFQESRAAPFALSSLVEVSGLGTTSTPPTLLQTPVVFDGAANLYYLLARVVGAPPKSTTLLRGFQVTYQV